ncbi:MAG: hypothetical protein JRG81_17515 [Deltaproteobacteria bacterium]|nr:hypothetical protein [Deltaproteobacteria bacterium]
MPSRYPHVVQDHTKGCLPSDLLIYFLETEIGMINEEITEQDVIDKYYELVNSFP